ncbi:unnamed protein product [marine sediment metagenome]|uniref:Uncharacterized protein n=1 Tax=marine sediment metagenome TaxID=412755 RepID=X1VW06_9ZZZZ
MRTECKFCGNREKKDFCSKDNSMKQYVWYDASEEFCSKECCRAYSIWYELSEINVSLKNLSNNR